MKISVTFEQPAPKDIIAQAAASGTQIHLITSNEQKVACPGEAIQLVFPSPATDLISLESVRKPNHTTNTTRLSQPQHIDTTKEQSFWKVPYDQGFVAFCLTYGQRMYNINLCITFGYITKFDCSLKERGTSLLESKSIEHS